MSDDLIARTQGKYECPECGGRTEARSLRPKQHKIVFVNHLAQCETGIRHRILATKNRRVPSNVQAH